ncbi:hypothetical protein B0H13DRAFT_2006514 [Mycena leptocephala]|nr:hypothetical protein B0H13DRAFT_2006514 [Mycena leptocephala]
MALTSHSLKSRLDSGSTKAFLRRHSHSPKGETPMPSSSGFTFAYQYTIASAACLVFLLILIFNIRALSLQGLDSVIDEALDNPDTRPKISDAFLDDNAQGGSLLWHDIMVRNSGSASHYHNYAGQIKQPMSLQPLYCCPRDPAKNASIEMSASTSAPAHALYAVGFLIAMPEPPLCPPLVSSSPDTSCSTDDNDHRILRWLEIGIAEVAVRANETRLYENCA